MDFSKYSPDWSDIIRPSILKRDNYKCAVCGVKHKSKAYRTTNGTYHVVDEFAEQWAKEHGKKVMTIFLNVAHLDHNKQNNDPSNLLSLCPIHHAKFDAEHKKILRISYKKLTHSRKVKKQEIFSLCEKVDFISLRAFLKENFSISLSVYELKEIVNFINNQIKN